MLGAMEDSRIAIVTGATSGIGAATARTFIQRGYGVIGSGRNAEALAALQSELGDSFVGVVGDVNEPNTLSKLFEASQTRFGRPVDLVVANAGRGLGGSVKDADLAEFESLLATNVTATLRLLQRAAQDMVALQADRFPKQAADIVVIGSVVGRNVSPFSAVYGSTKFAVHGMTEALRREVAGLGVRVSLVEPGIVVSGFQAIAGYSAELVDKFHQDFGPLLTSEDVAETIAFVVGLPPHVHISDIVVRPTRQNYP